MPGRRNAAEASVPVCSPFGSPTTLSRDARDVATAATAAHEPDLNVLRFMGILERSLFNISTGAPSTPISRRCCRLLPGIARSLTRWPTGEGHHMVHLVDANDTGPILAQQPVLDGDDEETFA